MTNTERIAQLKQTAPGFAKYTYDGVTYKLWRVPDYHSGGWQPWRASLEHSTTSGNAGELEKLATLAARLAEVCRELDND